MSAGNYIQIKINGEWVDLPDPDFGSGTFEISTQVSDGRNAKGNFVGKVIGSDKIALELKWSVLSPSKVATLLSYFNKNDGGHFIHSFRYYDPRENGWAIKKMYVSNRSGTPIMVKNASPKWITDVSISLVEV